MIGIVGTDPLVLRRVKRLAAEFDHELKQIDEIELVSTFSSFSILVLQVGADFSHLCDSIGESTETLILGYIDPIDQTLWREAERACFDVVTTKGALGPALREMLLNPIRRRNLVAVCDAEDIAGRIGFLLEFHDEDFGDISLWKIQSKLVATGRCPHQNACLGQGEINETVVTCPNHGSRFDLVTGERMRGPADFDLVRYKVSQDKGRIWVSKG